MTADKTVLTATGMKIAIAGGKTVVEPTDLVLRQGEIFGLVGESGSGKTTLGLSTMGYARPGLRIVAGEVRIDGASGNISRRGRVTYIPQNPGTSLNPALSLRTQLSEAMGDEDRKRPTLERTGRLLRMLSDVKLPVDAGFLDLYPHQLSGGQQQRICIAMAFAAQPRVIVMDEPTTGLDVTTQRHILDMVRQLCAQYRAAVLYISHDLAVVAALCTRIAVMQKGKVVETGTCTDILSAPSHPYTRQLLAAVPEFDPARDAAADAGTEDAPSKNADNRPIISVKGLAVAYGDFRVIEDLSLDVAAGECLALVGESGSGKTTLARCIAGLHTGSAGDVTLEGSPLAASARGRTADQRRRIQYIFQNPYTALNPKRTIGGSLLAALRVFNQGRRPDDRQVLLQTMEQVALDGSFLDRFPHQLSGGQRQRVAIARALIAQPDVMICDEITSALDVSVQAVIIDLLEKLRQERNLTMLFVTHNLALVRNFAQRVAVMHGGKIVDVGTVGRIFAAPQADETLRLINDTPHFVAPPGLLQAQLRADIP